MYSVYGYIYIHTYMYCSQCHSLDTASKTTLSNTKNVHKYSNYAVNQSTEYKNKSCTDKIAQTLK